MGKRNGNLIIFVKIKINKIIPHPNPNYWNTTQILSFTTQSDFDQYLDKAFPYCKWNKFMNILVCEHGADTA